MCSTQQSEPSVSRRTSQALAGTFSAKVTAIDRAITGELMTNPISVLLPSADRR
jgi:hypothetical protein